MVAVMKICKDCKFSDAMHLPSPICLSPKAFREINLITGAEGLAYCEVERKDYIMGGRFCGIEGKNWEAKDENVA
jgi:hypothetical protein